MISAARSIDAAVCGRDGHMLMHGSLSRMAAARDRGEKAGYGDGKGGHQQEDRPRSRSPPGEARMLPVPSSAGLPHDESFGTNPRYHATRAHLVVDLRQVQSTCAGRASQRTRSEWVRAVAAIGSSMRLCGRDVGTSFR